MPSAFGGARACRGRSPFCLNSGADFPICQQVHKAQCRDRAEDDEAPVRASVEVPTRMRGANRKGLSGRMSRMTLLDGNLWLSLNGKRMDASARAEGGYPPYNIELLPEDDSGAEVLRITLAVAGFARNELDVTVEDGELLIRGARHEDGSKDYLHLGSPRASSNGPLPLPKAWKCARQNYTIVSSPSSLSGHIGRE